MKWGQHVDQEGKVESVLAPVRAGFSIADLTSQMAPMIETSFIDDIVKRISKRRAEIPELPGYRIVEEMIWSGETVFDFDADDGLSFKVRWHYEPIPRCGRQAEDGRGHTEVCALDEGHAGDCDWWNMPTGAGR